MAAAEAAAAVTSAITSTSDRYEEYMYTKYVSIFNIITILAHMVLLYIPRRAREHKASSRPGMVHTCGKHLSVCQLSWNK